MFNMYVPIYSPALTITLMFYSETQDVQPEAHQSKKRHGRLRRNPWAQTNSCIYWPIRIEQLRCEEEENPYEVMEPTYPVLSTSAEDNEKNASIEEGLTACIEAKDLCSSQIEKSEDNGSMGNRDQADTEGPEPRSLYIEDEMDVEGQEPHSLHTEDEIDVVGQEPHSLHTEDEIDVEGQEPCSLHTENEKNASHVEVTTAL
ncbi:uncharacterized protein LOC127372034 isoform X2 [Dicentrarchus labrax]|uniref:uncharacterized protein LOC127360512 isoform X2 n=1 Tax=Dicentrarchus labrax TaxID=13489 RepID=UPI0021F65BE1|nr:uncharacterized protein LOC127360512 isoform X2 [Dicentrarchus labrax]XP_051271366.1 uncharacterized protein LOC127372034 isoform X2 [Dicentrarchus labrax]